MDGLEEEVPLAGQAPGHQGPIALGLEGEFGGVGGLERLLELELDADTFKEHPTEENITLALTYGMMSVEEDLNLVVTGSLSTPLYDEAPQTLSESVHDDINAIIGTIFSCFAARKPVALIDENALYAAKILHTYSPKLIQTCFYAGELNERSQSLLKEMGLLSVTTDKEDFTGEVVATVLADMKDKKKVANA